MGLHLPSPQFSHVGLRSYTSIVVEYAQYLDRRDDLKLLMTLSVTSSLSCCLRMILLCKALLLLTLGGD